MQDDEAGAGRVPERGPDGERGRGPGAPALAVAGAMVAGAAVGDALARAAGGGGGDPGTTLLVILLGGTAALGGGLRPGRRTAALTLCLAALACARAWVAHAGDPNRVPVVDGPAAEGPAAEGPAADVGRAGPRRAARARDAAQWDLGPRRIAPAMETAEGALRPGDLVAVLAGTERPRRARWEEEPRNERPLALRPRADEVVRLAPAARRGEPGESPRTGALGGLFARAREAGVERCLAHPDPDTGGLLAALLFGAPTHLGPGVTDLFTRTGTRHLLALSGFHVGLLGLIVVLPLARAGCALAGAALALAGSRLRPDPALPTALMALAFVPLSGAGAPAARAAIALSLAVVAPRCGRRPGGANLLGVALVLEVALDPLAPLDAGVQLSYLATLALVLVAPTAARRVMNRAAGWVRIERTDRAGRPRPALARAALERTVSLVACGVATSIVASLATLPVVWARFGEWSPIGLLATPLATPALVVLVGSGWAWLACPSLVGDGALAWSTRALLEGLALADHAPWSPLSLPERPILAIAAAAALALVGARRADPGAARRLLRVSSAALAVLVLPWPTAAGARPETLEVRVLDVGSGTAVVARAPGAPTWIFDAGSRDRVGVAIDAVGPLLRHLDVGRIRVVQSHDHVDHARDLPWIGRRWRPDLWVGRPPTSREDPWRGESPDRGARRLPAPPGRVRVSAPDDPLEVWTVRGGAFGTNEGSIALELRWRAVAGDPPRRAVLCSDAEEHGLAAVLAGDEDGPWLEPGPVDLLLLPHHGSRSRHLGALLDHLQPRLVVVSGAEEPAAGDELARRGTRVRATGLEGPILWRARGLRGHNGAGQDPGGRIP